MNLTLFLISAALLLFHLIKVIREKRSLSIDTIYQNDRLLAVFLIWTFMNLFLFFSADGSDSYFFPERYAQEGTDTYDAQELLVYVGGPVFIIYVLQLFKRNRHGRTE